MSDKGTAGDTSKNRRGGIGKITGTVGRRIDNPKGPIHVGTGKQFINGVEQKKS